MNKELNTIPSKNISIGKFTLAKTGLVINGDPTYDEWDDCGKFLRQAEKAVQFWIGDWLNYGDRKYGEMYSQAVEETDYTKGTLQNAKWVASKIEISCRHENLSFDHHRAVAPLPKEKQIYWLDKAEAEGMTRGELRHAITYEKLQMEVQSLPDDKYRVIYADPPWNYGNSGLDNYGHAERHYPSMTIQELCEMDIINIVNPDAVLFMWVTSPLLEECFPVINAWGFNYKTSFVWDKIGHNFGHYNSVRHELLLVCTRGICKPDSTELFDSVQTIQKSSTHSEKPEEFRQIIDTLYTHGKRIELFARKDVDGWDRWGNE